LTPKEAVSLAGRDDISRLWYVPPSLYPVYCRIIDGIEYAFKNNPTPSVINLSLGPPADVMPLAGNDDEPMNAATKKASDNGFVIVMAIGNYFDGDNDGTVNPWCRPDWVICVGAASSDATKIWPSSARGLPSDPRTWPDMVANGIDVISTWPTNIPKPENRRRDDEGNPVFQKSVPKEQWPNFTIESGTSQATGQVSRASAQIIAFVRNAAQQKGKVQVGDKLFSITVPQDRLAATSKRGPRLTGELRPVTGSTDTEITYRLVEPWRLVKQLLMDSAVPMPGFAPSVVGTGFVDPSYVDKQFTTGTATDIKIQPIKVLDK
jgi:subtilisin family serine protease